jgi:excisionase family DNA binding protein
MKAEIKINTQELIDEIVKEVVKRLKPHLNRKNEDDTIYDVKVLAEYLRVSEKWIYEQTHLKTIPHYKLNNQLRFRKKEIDKWMANNKVPTTSTQPFEVKRFK